MQLFNIFDFLIKKCFDIQFKYKYKYNWNQSKWTDQMTQKVKSQESKDISKIKKVIR